MQGLKDKTVNKTIERPGVLDESKVQGMLVFVLVFNFCMLWQPFMF